MTPLGDFTGTLTATTIWQSWRRTRTGITASASSAAATPGASSRLGPGSMRLGGSILARTFPSRSATAML